MLVQHLGQPAQVRRVEAAAHGPLERAGRRLEHLVEPRVVDLGEQDARRDLVQHAQPRVDRRLDRALVQEARGEGVDRLDPCAVRPRSASSSRARSSASVVVVARVLEPFAHARGELRRGLLGERDDDELVDRRVTGPQHLDEPRDQHGRLAGAGAGLDEQALVQ